MRKNARERTRKGISSNQKGNEQARGKREIGREQARDGEREQETEEDKGKREGVGKRPIEINCKLKEENKRVLLQGEEKGKR